MKTFWRAGMTISIALWMLAFGAQATLVDYGTCTVDDVTMDDGYASSDCLGWIGDINISLALVNDESFFAHNDWEFLGKDDGTVTGTIGLEVLTIGNEDGTWSVNPGAFDGYAMVMITLKNGNGASAYLFDDPSIFNNSGTWMVADAVNGSGREFPAALSNFNIFGRDYTEVNEPLTLSMAGLLLIALGLLRRVRQ